jgi:hypothetical protein
MHPHQAAIDSITNRVHVLGVQYGIRTNRCQSAIYSHLTSPIVAQNFDRALEIGDPKDPAGAAVALAGGEEALAVTHLVQIALCEHFVGAATCDSMAARTIKGSTYAVTGKLPT